MSNFTTELRKIINSGVNIFNFDYDLHDPLYKPTLEEKIIKHYYFREIGSETVGRFIQRLDTKLNEILPKYNLMYEAVATGIDPLQQKKSSIIKEGTIIDDIDRGETVVIDDDTLDTTVLDDDTTNQVVTVVDSDQSDVIANSQKFSDTPQGRTDLSNTDYLTELTEEDNNVTTALDSTSTSNVTGTQDSTTTVTGRKDTTTTTTGNEDQTRTVNETMTSTESDRTQADLLEEFRRLYNDIDMLIIDDLGVLFMGLYD